MPNNWLSKNDILKKRKTFIESNNMKNLLFCDNILLNFYLIENELKKELSIFPKSTYFKEKFKFNTKILGECIINPKIEEVRWEYIDFVEKKFNDFINSYSNLEENNDLNKKIYTYKIVLEKLEVVKNNYLSILKDFKIFYSEKYKFIKIQDMITMISFL